MRETIIEIENGPEPQPDINILSQLRAVIDYTSENCPVENVSTFHDGRPILGANVMALAEKLREQACVTQGGTRP